MGGGHLDIQIKPCYLFLSEFVFRHLNNVRYVLSRLHIGSRVGNNKLFRRNKLADSPPQKIVVVNLLESRPCERKVKQHLIEFRSVLLHYTGKLVVHVVANPFRLIFNFRSYPANNLRPHGASRRKKFSKSLRLKLGNRFRQKRMGYAARAPERFSPFLVFETKKFEPLAVGFFPILASVLVVVVVSEKIRGNSRKL